MAFRVNDGGGARRILQRREDLGIREQPKQEPQVQPQNAVVPGARDEFVRNGTGAAAVADVGGGGTVDPKVQAQRDADFINEARTEEEATRRLETALSVNPSDEYRAALAAELARRMVPEHPANANVDDLQAKNERIGAAIVNVTERSGRDLAVQLARGFAEVANDQQPRLGNVVMGDYYASAIEKAMADKGALRFGLALTDELVRTGNTRSAYRTDQVMSYAMYRVQSAFNDANGNIERIQQDLAKALGPVGGALTEDQRRAAVEAFQSRHSGAYQQWEDAGRRYAEMMKAIGEADRSVWGPEQRARFEGFVRDLPNLSRTQAGMELLSGEIEKQGAHRPSLMDEVARLGEQGKWSKDLLESFSIAVSRSVGMRALAYAQAGQVEAASSLLEGLRRNAGLFGVDAHTMDDVVNALRSARPGMSGAELEAWTRQYNQALDKVNATGINPTSGPMQALRALGLTVGLAYTVNGALSSEADIVQRTQYISDSIGLTAEAGALGLEALQASGRMAANGTISTTLGNVFRVTGTATKIVSGVADGIMAARAFANGQPIEGAAYAQKAAGGLLLAAASVGWVPGWGNIAGAALMIGGLVTEQYGKWREDNRIRDLRRDLLAASGVTPEVSEALRNMNGDRMRELVHEMKMTPEQIQEMAQRWPFLITQGEGNGVSFYGLKQMAQASGLDNGEVMDLLRRVGSGQEPERMLMILLTNTGPSFTRGPTQTLEDWIAIAQRNISEANSYGYPEVARMWSHVRDVLVAQRTS